MKKVNMKNYKYYALLIIRITFLNSKCGIRTIFLKNKGYSTLRFCPC